MLIWKKSSDKAIFPSPPPLFSEVWSKYLLIIQVGDSSATTRSLLLCNLLQILMQREASSLDLLPVLATRYNRQKT